MDKKIVHSSHLALRFYFKDGWDLPTVLKYVRKGGADWTGGEDWRYIRFDIGTEVNMKALYENEVSKVIRYTEGIEPYLTDLEYMESFNGF